MAKVLLKLDLFPSGDTKIDNFKIENVTTNNTSKPLGSKLEKNSGRNCLIAGRYAETKKLGGKLCSSYNGLQGGITSPDGVLNVKLTLNSTNNMQYVTVCFDKEANQFAKECIVDGKTYYNDDSEWTILFETPSTTKTILFTKWNRGNYHWCITYVAAELDKLVLGERNLRTINSLIQSQPTQDAPFFGLIRNTGDFLVKSNNNELIDYANDGILKENQTVEIFINNKKIATHIISEWENPNYIEKTIHSTLSDNGYILDKHFNGYKWDEKLADGSFRATDLLQDILKEIPELEYYIPKNVWTRLSGIKLNAAYLEPSTYKEAINKICEAVMLNCTFVNNVLTFFDAKPKLVRDVYGNIIEPIINITSNAQENDFSQQTITKNNYDSVRLNYWNYGRNITLIHKENFNTLNDSSINIKESINKQNGYENITFSTNGKYKIAKFTKDFEMNENFMFFNYNLQKTVLIKEKVSRQNEVPYIIDTNYNNRNLDNYSLFVFLDDNTKDSFFSSTFSPSDIIKIGFYRVNARKFRLYCILVYETTLTNGSSNTISVDLNLYNYTYEKNTRYYNNKKGSIIYDLNENFHNELISNANTVTYSKDEGLPENDSVPNYIAQSILNNYKEKNGIRTAELTIRCGVNFYDTSGNLVVDWSNKDSNLPNSLQVGQIVKILNNKGESKSKYKNGVDRIWRIIGCELVHEVVPKWKIQLMEVW